MTAQHLVAGLVQLSVGDDPALNLPVTTALIREAAAKGATYIQTPEATNLLSSNPDWKDRAMRTEADDPTLAALRQTAADLGVWLQIGSLSLKAQGNGGDGRYLNRGFVIDPKGAIAAHYDKLHMFDVAISDTESFRESATFQPGDRAVVVDGPVRLGLSICYDLRFAYLFRALAQAGAQVLAVPAAFNPTTGAAHWETLLRARAIETGCFVLAAAQCGTHPAPHDQDARARKSWGHSLAVAPWGEVLADAGTEPCAITIPLDLGAVDRARSRVPSLTHDRKFSGP